MTLVQHRTITFSESNVSSLIKQIKAQGWEVEPYDLSYYPLAEKGIWRFNTYRKNEDAESSGETVEECLKNFLNKNWSGHGQFLL